MGELAELWNKQTPLHTGTLAAQAPALGRVPERASNPVDRPKLGRSSHPDRRLGGTRH